MGKSPGLILALFAALAIGTAGCGPDIRGLCEATEDCRGGNEADVDACVAAGDYQAEIADIEGCTDEFETYLACFIDTADCNTADTGVTCDSSKDCKAQGFSTCSSGTCRSKTYGFDDPDDCEAEFNAYKKCQ